MDLNIPEYENTEDQFYWIDLYKDGRSFPVLFLGRDSYVVGLTIDNPFDTSKDEHKVHNVQIGRYSSLANGILFMVDMNHDYRKVAQGRIGGVDYSRPVYSKRKGQIIVMNDCWIGKNATVMSGVTIGNGAVVAAGSLVTKDVPPYAIVGGNPARVIGYRFNEEEIAALNKIRWWNWDTSKVREASGDLYGDIDRFIDKYLAEAVNDINSIPDVSIPVIEKPEKGKTYLLIPDFDQSFPTYLHVIDEFAKGKSGTYDELLVYVKQDELFDQKIDVLNKVFALYEKYDCYVNLFTAPIEDERSLFGSIDYYITTRSGDNIRYMDMAELFGVQCISGVDTDAFQTRTKGIEKR